MVTEASDYLVTLARRISAACTDQTDPRAILLTGSTAAGISDYFSDLDLIVYYDRLPTEDRLAAARARIEATASRPLSRCEDGLCLIEEFTLGGVECQLGHFMISAWERELASVLEECKPATLTEKAIMGVLGGVALHGHALIRQWQERAAQYPGGLARATIEHYLKFFPLWYVPKGWWDLRDATIFYHQMLVEVSLNLLGVLAGLNRLYFSTFQVKRVHQLAQGMRIAPESLADRLDEVFTLDPVAAGMVLEHLVAETLTLVEAHMPEIDTTPARRFIGMSPHPWHPRTG